MIQVCPAVLTTYTIQLVLFRTPIVHRDRSFTPAYMCLETEVTLQIQFFEI